MANLCKRALDDQVEAGRGDAPALLFARQAAGAGVELRPITYRALLDEVSRVAGGLRALGVGREARVAVYLPKRPELYSVLLAVARVGALALPAPDTYRREALRHRLQDCDAGVLVTERALLGQVPFEDLPGLKTVVLLDGAGGPSGAARVVPWTRLLESSPAAAEDVPDSHPLAVHYTAGAMGRPKGIVHVHRLGEGWRNTTREVLDVRPGSRVWCTAHPGWLTGLGYSLYGPLLCGATSVVNLGPFDPALWMRILQEAAVEVWYTVPSALHRMKELGPAAEAPAVKGTLRWVMTSEERLSASLVDWSREALGIEVRDSWWMTETGAICLAQKPGTLLKPGALGVPVEGLEAGILDPQGRPLPVNQIGFLALRRSWPWLMASVWNNEQAYLDCFVGDWFVSRDYAYVDDDGHYHFQGRTEETIKVVAERVNPFEVEDALLRHPAVAEVAVIGKPGAEGRELIKAFVVLVAGFEAGQELIGSLRRHVGETLGPLSRPEEFEFLAALPKTRAGKVLRRVLRAREAGLPPGDTSTLAEGRDL